MSNHQRTIVPIEAWAYHSPDVRDSGKLIDIGLFAEALLYYEEVLVVPSTEVGFASFIRWFADRGCLPGLLALIADGSVGVYHYAFFTLPLQKDGSWSLWNTQDEEAATQPVFEKRILEHRELSRVIKAPEREKLKRALEGRVIERKSTLFGPAINNAVADFRNPERVALAVQAYVDEISRMRGVRNIPEIVATVTEKPDGRHNVSWNINFESFSKGLDPDAQLRPHIPLTALGHANRAIWSAADLGCDAYLHAPLSTLVGDKLYEAASRAGKIKQVIDGLQEEVEFPDVRALVNAGKITFADVLTLRAKAKRFRAWLQDEADRDRNAILAYHNETAKESGLITGTRKVLRLFGSGLGAASGALVGGTVAGPLGTAVGAAAGQVAGTGVEYLFDVASRMDADWKPVMFGRWAKDRIEKLKID